MIPRFGAISTLRKLVDLAEQVEGRVRLQKTLYLLKCLGVVEVSQVPFRYHHYGPYSELVAGALREAVARGVIAEDRTSFEEEWQLYTYRPGTNADLPPISTESGKVIEQTLAATKDVHWRVLELAATAAFLARENGLSDEAAMSQALELKPPCRPYRQQSHQILSRLGLVSN